MVTKTTVKNKPAAPGKILSSLKDDKSYDYTVSEDGKTESMILLHSRMGIRIEFNLHKSALALWLSPQAGKNVNYKFRNFSCRDDHTSIFDKITFPELSAKKFVRCDYDPFHCILRFEGQTLHLASLLDKPVVLVWTEREEVVDFKGDKQDSIVRRSKNVFTVRHPDRGLFFDFVAALGKGETEFIHQPEVDTGRSTYARVVLQPGQLLVIGGELVKEKVESAVTAIAGKPMEVILDENEKKIAARLKPGAAVIKNNPEMQKLYDINKRHLLSVQDASGAIRAALKYVYYLIWTTDGSVTSTSMFQTGWQEFLKLWLEYLLANPTSQENPPHGRFFGQLANGRITKREEFGALCAVWPAFMYWGLTGDPRFVSGKHLKTLEDAVDWLERYCFDEEMGALGTYYLGGGSEDPFYGSNDFGWDAAVGCFMARACYAPHYDGRLIRRVYEFNMNLNQYNIYLMLSAASSGAKSAAYLEKAKRIEKFLLKLRETDAKAYYLVEGKGLVLVKNKEGYREGGLLAVQSQSPAFFMPDFPVLFLQRMRNFKPYAADSEKGQWACVFYGRLAGLDTEFVDEREIMQSLEASLPYHIRPSRYIPMPYTMVEVIGARDGEFHDIRPQAFSAGPFQAAVANLAVRTMPFGVAIRGTNYLAEYNHFEYLHGHLNIRYRGSGKIAQITLNGKPLEYTLQAPDARIKGGSNDVLVELSTAPPMKPLLVYSTVRLKEVECAGKTIRYRIYGYCQNVLVFKNLNGEIRVLDSKKRNAQISRKDAEQYSFIEFSGKGVFTVEVI
ncbi:MAG: hypothetical protein ACM3WV_01140 [Bacillota bacterium]